MLHRIHQMPEMALKRRYPIIQLMIIKYLMAASIVAPMAVNAATIDPIVFTTGTETMPMHTPKKINMYFIFTKRNNKCKQNIVPALGKGVLIDSLQFNRYVGTYRCHDITTISDLDSISMMCFFN